MADDIVTWEGIAMGFNGLVSSWLNQELTVCELPASLPAGPLSSLVQLMGRVRKRTQRAVRSLCSPHENLSSLGAAFAGVPNEWGFPPAVGFRVIVEGRQRELKPALRSEVHRIVQEAIVNAYRHSGAKDIEAVIAYRPTHLRIAVRDNGCGIDPQALQWRRRATRGLQGMRERADRLGAQLRVLSRTAAGTEVELSLPAKVAFEQSGGVWA
jgi:glucose-6-phosphate-specific signal transduction histidine kinase